MLASASWRASKRMPAFSGAWAITNAISARKTIPPANPRASASASCAAKLRPCASAMPRSIWPVWTSNPSATGTGICAARSASSSQEQPIFCSSTIPMSFPWPPGRVIICCLRDTLMAGRSRWRFWIDPSTPRGSSRPTFTASIAKETPLPMSPAVLAPSASPLASEPRQRSSCCGSERLNPTSPVRYLIISALHATLEALTAALAQSAGGYDRTLCCGDLVGYGADPNPVCDWVRLNCAVVVRGNHDRGCTGQDDLEWFIPVARQAAIWTQQALSPENAEYILGLPQGPVTVEAFQIFHGSPYDEDEYVVAACEANQAFAYLETRVAFFGPPHMQGGFIWTQSGGEPTPPPPAHGD